MIRAFDSISFYPISISDKGIKIKKKQPSFFLRGLVKTTKSYCSIQELAYGSWVQMWFLAESSSVQQWPYATFAVPGLMWHIIPLVSSVFSPGSPPQNLQHEASKSAPNQIPQQPRYCWALNFHRSCFASQIPSHSHRNLLDLVQNGGKNWVKKKKKGKKGKLGCS